MNIKRIRHIAALLAAVLGVAHAAPAFKVEVTGQGAPVILIPGLASSGDVWQDTARHLCGPRQCHVLTLAGFAGQPPVEGALLPQVEQELSAYIAARKLDKPVIIGHSLGGFVGMRFAIDHPDQLSRLVIVDAVPALGAAQGPDITPAQMKQIAAGARERILQAPTQRAVIETMATNPNDVDRIVGWSTQSHRPTVANAMYELLSTDLRADIARIQAPTLVLGTWVAYQAYAPRAAIEQNYRMQYARLPAAQIEMADTARHFIMYDDPAWLYDRIDRFLQRTR